MAETLSTGSIGVDIQPFLDQLGLAQQGVQQLSAQLTVTADTSTKKFAEAAAANARFSDTLAASTGELRAAQAATQSARDALRDLVAQQKELTTAQSKTNSTTAEYQRLQKLLEQNRLEIQKAKQAIDDNKQAVLQERAALDQVREARRQETNEAKLTAAAQKDLTAQVKAEASAQKEAASAANQAGAATKEAGEGTSFFGGLLSKASGLFAGLFAVNKLKQVAGEIIDTTAEFQRLEAVLTTINGGDEGKGKLEFAALRQFTLRNPFEVQAVTEAYVQLRNRGINPTMEQLQSLADLAAASGKSFDQVTEGLLGATTGQYRRLKEFGVSAQQQGDTVAFTFRGVTTVVQKSQTAIADYVLSLGQLNGVAGATERIMNTTGGRITNLKDSFTELFATIGEGTDGPLNGFINRLTILTTKIREALKSTDQKAADRTAATGALPAYAVVVDKLFADAKEQVKKAGFDSAEVLANGLRDTYEQQAAVLGKQLAEAKKTVQGLPQDYTQAYLDKYGDSALDKEASDKAEADRVAAKQRVLTIQGELTVLRERYDIVTKGNQSEADRLGLIEALEKKIAELQERRKNSTDRGEILDKGGLNEQIKEAQKQLDILLGKENAVRKARQYSYESQLRALLQERATLTSLAGKASEQMADDATARAKAVFDEGLRAVDVVQAKLVQRELDLRKAAAKVGGGAVARLGEKADGVVDGVQEQQLTQLRLAALDKYYTDLYKITEAREQRLFNLRADSNDKEVEAVDRKYDHLIAAAKDNIERQAIEEARAREQVALRAQQEQTRINQTAALATNNAQAVGQVFGKGTGISVFEAKRAEQQALLDIEKKAAEDSLNNTLNKVGKEAEIERSALRAQLARIGQQQKDLDRETALSKLNIYKLVLGDEDNDKNRQQLTDEVNSIRGSINNIIQLQEQAADAQIAARNRNIDELQSQLAAQIQLNQQGSASNIKGLQDQIKEEKAARSEALAAKREAQKEAAIISELEQASSLASAAAKLIDGWATIPIAGQILGAVSIAAMLASFIATKSAAASAAQASFFVGGYTGDGNPRDVSTAQGPRPYEYHKREFIMNHELTDQYRKSLFEPLHNGKPLDWSDPQLRALMPDYSLPATLLAEKAEAVRVQHEHSFAPMQAKFDALEARLASIDNTNAQMAERWDSHHLADGRVLLIDPVTGSTHYITER